MTSSVRRILTAVGIATLAGMAGAIVLFFLIPEGDPTELKSFPRAEQYKKAQRIVDALNGHNVTEVNVLRGNNRTDPHDLASQREQDMTIQAAMPAQGCSYSLTSVDDQGKQGKILIPGITRENTVYLLDVNVEEHCPLQAPRSRTLGLYFIQFMAHWTPVSFTQ